MAILDELLMLEDGAPLTVSRVGSNTIDLGTGAAGGAGSGTRDIGAMTNPLTLSIRWPVLPQASGAATIAYSLMTSSDGSTFIMLQQSAAVPYTNFSATAPWGLSPSWRKFPLPSGVRRYLRLDWSVGTGPLTAGTLLASLSTEVEYAGQAAYPKAYVS